MLCRVFVWEIAVNSPFQKTHIGNLTCIIPVRIPSQNNHLGKLTCNFPDDCSKSIRNYCDASSGKSLCYAMLDHSLCWTYLISMHCESVTSFWMSCSVVLHASVTVTDTIRSLPHYTALMWPQICQAYYIIKIIFPNAHECKKINTVNNHS